MSSLLPPTFPPVPPTPTSTPPPQYPRLPDHNPCYLLSGVLMLAGCFVVSQAAHAEPDRIGPVWWALGVLCLYEVLVIALTLVLAHRLRLMRDAGHLLAVEALLLADFPLLFNELFLARPIAGGIAAGLGLVLALVKVVIILRALGVRPRVAMLGIIAASLTLVYGTPGLMRFAAPDGFVPQGLMHALWWAVGFVIAAVGVLRVWERPLPTADPDRFRLARFFRQIVVGLGIVSAIGHIAVAHWAFVVPFLAVDAAPLLLGLAALAAGRAMPGEHRATWATSSLVCLGAGLAASIATPAELIATITPDFWLTLTPMRWALLAGAATLGHLAWRARNAGWLAGIPVLLVPAVLGPTPGDTVRFLASIVRTIAHAGDALVPRSATAWGFTVMAFAFLVLILGVLWSLLRPRQAE